MYTLLSCTNCGRKEKSIGEPTAWVRVNLSHSEHCSSCDHSHTKEESINFCQMQCMIQFTKGNPNRLVKFEQDMVLNIRKYRPDYVNPLTDPNAIPNAEMQLSQEEKDLIAADKIIPAFKSLRTRYGISLQDCKDILDRYRKQKGYK